MESFLQNVEEKKKERKYFKPFPAFLIVLLFFKFMFLKKERRRKSAYTEYALIMYMYESHKVTEVMMIRYI